MLLIIFLSIFQTLSGTTMTGIIPEPQKIIPQYGVFVLRDELRISSDNFSNIGFEYLQESFSKFGTKIIKISKDDEKEVDIKFMKVNNFNDIPADKYDEGYQIVISDKEILVKYYSEKGKYYSCLSLIQLIEKNERGIPGMEITDWPDLLIRGVSDDISRGQVSTIENFKRIIKHISMHKMNRYMPYLEDMVQLKEYPTIGLNRGALTKSEISELIEYAELHFVEIIPIYQTLGHFENILVQQEFLKYAEFPGAASLDVSNEETYLFLENMLKEVFELFPSEYIHIGADESWDAGKGKSKVLADEMGLGKLHANHYKRIYNIAKKYNKKVIMYSDIILQHPEILDLIPKDIIIFYWSYGPKYNYSDVQKIKNSGFNFIVSPSVWNFLTTYPANDNAFPNIYYLAKTGVENNSLGLINSNWGDYGAETIKELVLMGYSWSAQCSWSLSKSEINNFSKSFTKDFFGVYNKNLHQVLIELGRSGNNKLWHEIWRHPSLGSRESAHWEGGYGFAGKLFLLKQSVEFISGLLEDIKTLKNEDFVEILVWTNDLHRFFIIKNELAYLLDQKINGTEINAEILEDNLLKCKSELVKLKNSYNSIWKKYYKSDNLNMINDKFDRLLQYFEEIYKEVQNDDLKKPLLSSEWIMHPEEFNESTFIYEFELSKFPEEAKLQVIADTYAEIIINNVHIDTVFAKRSLSLLVDYHRIKYLNIKDILKKGINRIELNAKRFGDNEAASVNLIGRIIVEKNEIFIRTDENWDVTNDKIKYVKSKIKSNKSEIIEPNFNTDRTSWIER